MHTRRIEFQAFQRDDGLWDLEAHLIDVKPIVTALESGPRAPGEPIHDMWLRLTIDADMNVIEAVACTDSMPYPGYCQRITPDYAKLAGLNLMSSFRRRVIELFGGVAGCTHLTEMLWMFPTAAIQSFFRKPRGDDVKPFQLDHCHALQTTGEPVQRYYPRWYVGPARPALSPSTGKP
jgi:Protein of unknown function (DUF2889)